MHLMTLAVNAIRRKGYEITQEEEQAVLLAILLHDIGHGPFSHSLEYDIVKNVTHEQISTFFINNIIGSFGRVRLARNKKSGEYFAMKILKKADIIKLK
jgi:HD superfamily phosphohydrolase